MIVEILYCIYILVNVNNILKHMLIFYCLNIYYEKIIYLGGCLVKESSYVDSKHEYYSGNRANNGGGISFL